jgi:hypothetical protein
MRKVVKRSGKVIEIKKAYYVPNVAAKHIIGNRTRNVMNVSIADIARVYGAIQ